MAYDPRSQYKAPPRPYYNNRAPQTHQNQDYGYAQDPYASEEQRPDSYRGYDGDGFWEDYAGGYDEGYGYDQQYHYAHEGQYGSQHNLDQPSYDDHDNHELRTRGHPQQTSQGRGGYPLPVNGQMRPPADPRAKEPPHAYAHPPNRQMQDGYAQLPNQMRNDGYGRPAPGQRMGTPPGPMQNDGYGRPATATSGGTPPRQRLRRHAKPLRIQNMLTTL